MARVAFDPFEALGLPRDASPSDIKAQYHALARRYHPNRHQGSDECMIPLSEHFYNVHQAWKILSKADNRKRCVELLNLLELQDEMLTHYTDVINSSIISSEGHEHEPHASDQDGHISSDADEDLPNVGLQRRQTVLGRDSHGLRHLGGRRESLDAGSPLSPTKKASRWQLVKDKTSSRVEDQQEADYFMMRRRKLEKLRRKELGAFLDYRDAMVAKFEAEEEAEKLQEVFERARWKREYFERAPRGTTERMRSFLNAMGAVSAFEQHAAPRQRNRSNLSLSSMSPILGPGESAPFLNPDLAISRQKSVHRRIGSNDISGDQTSSSEEESGEIYRPRRTSPPGQWHHFSRRNRSFPPNHTESAQNDRPGSHIRPSAIPFQLVVRQPTDLGTIAEIQDSSGETPSGSSRSPSPHITSETTLDNSKFTVVGSHRTAELFNMPEGRARSPSPVGHHHRLPLTNPTKANSNSTVEGCQLTISHLVMPQHRHVPLTHVHLLSREEKSRMLGSEPDAASNPAELLQRLRRLNPSVASQFEVKPDMEELFKFRLIYGNREVVSRQHQSFIALSYRRKLHVERHQHHFSLPLEPEIFQAVWNERKSESEAIWIDQICIDQESDEERTVSMSAMDMVYRSARLIVVALDDIELDVHEGELLQNHIDEYNSMTHVPPRRRFRRKQPPYLDSRQNLYRVIKKMLRSSWSVNPKDRKNVPYLRQPLTLTLLFRFKRAWCRHEMRLAKHHIFLIPCRRPGSPSKDVLRFNSKCIAHLLALSIEVMFDSEIEAVKPALHNFFHDRSKMSPEERQMRLHHGNFSTVAAEVFAMEAGGDPRIPAEQRLSDARMDKISIILNTMECGLALKRSFRSHGFYGDDNHCYHDLSLLALAAGDPGVLCSVGPSLPLPHARSSWLCVPTVADAGLNETKTLQSLPLDISLATGMMESESFIQLDLKFLPRHGERPIKDSHSMEVARHIFEVCQKEKWGRNRRLYKTKDPLFNRLFGPMQDIYVETLACILRCGPDWMSDVCQRYGMGRWKVDLQGAYELLIAMKNTHGRWPVTAWSERAAGFILDFTNFLIIRGLPVRQLSKPEPWRPLSVVHHGVKIITFTPVSEGRFYPAIPKALLHADYVHLARLWILSPRCDLDRGDEEGPDARQQRSEWNLLGKSVLFSDENSIGKIGGDFKDQQQVYGRRANMSNGATWDRSH